MEGAWLWTLYRTTTSLFRYLRVKQFLTVQACLEKRPPTKVVIDIGGKRTWLMTANFSLQHHLSMIAVPKLLRCYDCDSTLGTEDLSYNFLAFFLSILIVD
jgi:hypothetical protein